ncbi:amidohydrolase family protein [Amycolatopsis suaedae]|uniref:Amidohydrolase n=1 Tax=Amycolatopsis suaedae TaxID=2510978 RepID=A0A4Q7JAE7_9PSEU|nr:amidohydrolase family protein [Amycolatopsis suaedae]RZQ64239.1 amidohydrolase [Amycolatopsis suaedae]
MARFRSTHVFALTLALLLGAALLVGLGRQPAAEDFTGSGKVVIRDASLVLTMDPALGDLTDADVLIDGDRIAAVGRDLPAPGARTVDGRGRIVLPGFVDLHNHLWQTLIRGCATQHDVNGWFGRCVRPLYSSPVSEADGYAGTRLGSLDVISTGITTVTDWSHAFNADFGRGDLRALEESGLRFVLAYNATTSQAVQDEIRRIKREEIDPNPLAALHVAAHPSTGNYPSLEAGEKLARELGVALNVHLHESPADPATGQMDALRRAGALRPGLLVNHAVHMTDAELDELAAHGTRVAHNPLSNMRLASGVIRLAEMHRRGIPVGLGLDGGTNDTSDMFNDMRTAVGLQRATSNDPGRYPTPTDVLRMATLGGAEALGMQQRVGSLTPGKQADVQVVNAQALNFAPRVDWAAQLVFNTQPANVEWVFVAGRALKRDGRLVGVDTGRVIADAQAAADRIHKLLPR